MTVQPSRVELVRGSLTESVHVVAAAVCDAAGRLVASAGDDGLVTYMRSAAKPLQALALIESGAAAALALSPAEIAVTCASHSAEDVHVRTVRDILRKAGVREADLHCGVHPPINRQCALRLFEAKARPTEIHCNCSGKHAGMLAVCSHAGWPHEGYWRRDHPLQQLLLHNVAAMTGVAPEEVIIGVDGCGVPVHGMPLSAMATGLARLADPSPLKPARAAAARTIVAAMQAHPVLVAGTGRFTTELMANARPAVVAKSGAEAVYAVGLPGLGLGVVLKVLDGNARATAPATLAILEALQALDQAQLASLDAWRRPVVRNMLGDAVGHLEPHIELVRGGE